VDRALDGLDDRFAIAGMTFKNTAAAGTSFPR
jgi:hypothetical protein